MEEFSATSMGHSTLGLGCRLTGFQRKGAEYFCRTPGGYSLQQQVALELPHSSGHALDLSQHARPANTYNKVIFLV